MTGFDARRALLVQRDIFRPFRIQATCLLSDALARGDLGADVPVLAVERGTATMVLLTRQLTYHHVAQGEIEGEPFLVSF